MNRTLNTSLCPVQAVLRNSSLIRVLQPGTKNFSSNFEPETRNLFSPIFAALDLRSFTVFAKLRLLQSEGGP
jgi:hypothetical protein